MKLINIKQFIKYIIIFSVLASIFIIYSDKYNAPFLKLATLSTFQQEYVKNENLVIHIICHSHDDTGYKKTVDDYYYGNNNREQKAGVQYIIDTVVTELQKNPNRTFIQVETAFFYRWWKQQNLKKQNIVKDLVKSGQLEFINGGWCMNDEATPYYEDIIDQMTIGHQFLFKTFNITPTVGWHIDPFGHSNTNAALFSQLGFNGWFFARIDYQDMNLRKNDSRMEFIWQPKLKQTSQQNYIFTGVNYAHYSSPYGFCYDQSCTDAPIMDDPRLTGYNVDKRAEDFVQYFLKMSKSFKSNNLMHTFGEDFDYSNAIVQYKNLDKLIKYINENPQKFNNTQVIYSTPSRYLNAINKQNISFPSNQYDLFPYASDVSNYWTGYFTSRPTIKGYVKQTGRYLQSMRTYLSILKFYNQSEFVNKNQAQMQQVFDKLEQAMGILQHHDAVAGTERQYVADNYYKMGSEAEKYFNSFLFEVLLEQTQKIFKIDIDSLTTCYTNQTSFECPIIYHNILNKKNSTIVSYNPANIHHYILRFKVPNAKFDLIDQNNQKLHTEIICSNFTDATDCDAFFKYSLKTLDLSYFIISPNDNPQQTFLLEKKLISKDQTIKITISNIKSVEISQNNNDFSYIYNKNQNNFTISYQNYVPFDPSKGYSDQAYIFRPNAEQSTLYSTISEKYYYFGEILTNIHLIGDKTDSQMRFFNIQEVPDADQLIELETFVDSISLSNKVGIDVILQIETKIQNNNTFFTDSNGLEMQQRVLNYRPTWNLTVTEKVAGNYYPITALIQINDEKSEKGFLVFTDRCQGGSSLKQGQVELMIHRRLTHNSGFGEPLNETKPWNKNEGLQVRVKHQMRFINNKNEINSSRYIQNYFDRSPQQFFGNFIKFVEKLPTNSNSYYFKQIDTFFKQNEEIQSADEDFLKINLRYMGDNSYLLRLNNMNEYQSINFINIFGELTEKTLNAIQSKSDWANSQLKWQFSQINQNTDQSQNTIKYQFQLNESILIQPLEIRTFVFRKN